MKTLKQCFILALYVAIFLNVILLLAVFLSDSQPHDLFEGFDNQTGTRNGCYIIPNYVHFVRFNSPTLSFGDAVCILAAFKHQRPDKIFIHTNVKPKGKYWDVVRSVPGMNSVLDFQTRTIPTSIFGQKLNKKWLVYHGGDITRIRVLMEYGGIFLDNDSYIVRSLNVFRKFEFSLGWIPGKTLENQIVLAHPKARFLKLWLESYKNNYKRSKWYYNAGAYPTKILEQRPYLVHRVPQLFGTYGVVRKVFMKKWKEWKSYYAVHLMIRHQYLLKSINANATYPVKFDENNVHKYPVAFRDMVYEVYPYPNTNFNSTRVNSSDFN